MISVLLAVMVVAVLAAVSARAPERLLPRCAARTTLAKQLLQDAVADVGWIGPEHLQRSLTERSDRRGGGLRWAVTDVVDGSAGPRFLVWAFVEGDDDGARGAFVNDTERRLTTVVAPCIGD